MKQGNPVYYRRIEQSLAGLFVGLLALYAVGTLVKAFLPVVHAAGVVAVHLAVLVGFLLPAAVLGQTLLSHIGRRATTHGRATAVIAALAIVSLLAALLRASAPYADVLAGIAAAGSLLLAGRVLTPLLT